MTGRAAAALAAAAALGPFFALQTEDDVEPGWVSWADLVTQPEPLGRRVREVRALLASGPGTPEVPARVAASIVHLGLIARLISPALGAALAAGVVPVLPAGSIRLRPTGSTPLPMTFRAPTGTPVGGPAQLAAELDRAWSAPLIAPLNDAIGRRYRLSEQVLHGNVASAIAGTLQAATTTRPDLAGTADAALDALLATGSLAGRGRRRNDNGAFVRRSCCLLVRLPGAGTCGDCVLTDDPAVSGLPGV